MKNLFFGDLEAEGMLSFDDKGIKKCTHFLAQRE